MRLEQRVFPLRIDPDADPGVIVVPQPAEILVIDHIFGREYVDARSQRFLLDEDLRGVFAAFYIHVHLHAADCQRFGVDIEPAAEPDFVDALLLVETDHVKQLVVQHFRLFQAEIVVLEHLGLGHAAERIPGLIHGQRADHASLILDQQRVRGVIIDAAAALVDAGPVRAKAMISGLIDVYNRLIQ